MNRNQKDVFRKLQLLLIIACSSLPLVWILAVWQAGELLSWLWVFPGGYVLLGTLSIFVPGKVRLAYGIVVAAVFVSVCGFFAPEGLRVVFCIAAFFYAVLLLWSLKIAAWSQSEEIPSFWITFGVAAHLAGQVAAYIRRVSDHPAPGSASLWLQLSLLAFVLLTMLSMNRASLVAASGKRQKVSSVMRQKNVMLTMALFALAFAISFIPSAFQWIKGALLWLFSLLESLLRLLTPDSQQVQSVVMDGSQPMMPEQSSAQPSAFALFMEKVTLYVGGAISIGLITYCAYRLVRILLSRLLRLWQLLGRYASSVSEDYEDEITDTRDSNVPERLFGRRSVPKISVREERALAPGERIRYRYLRLSARHPEWKSASTARENLPAPLASLYERVRYSDHPVTEAEAADFTEGTRRI